MVATAVMLAPVVTVVTALPVRPGLAPTAARVVTAVMPAPWVSVVRRVPATVAREVTTAMVPTVALAAMVGQASLLSRHRSSVAMVVPVEPAAMRRVRVRPVTAVPVVSVVTATTA